MSRIEPYRSALEARREAGASAVEAFEDIPVPHGRYMVYIWEEEWLGGNLTWEEFVEVYEAGRRWGLELYELNKVLLAEQLRQADRLKQAGVPYIHEFSRWLIGWQLRDENAQMMLWQLIEQLQVTNESHLAQMMEAIAFLLLNRLTLCAGPHRYRLTEVEFYYRRAADHADPYVHGGPEQREACTWFYNLAGGLDLTCGNAATGTEGGILLRGMRRLDSEQPAFVSGVQLVLRELVSALGTVLAQGSGWYFQPYDEPTDHPVWKAKRVGLTVKDNPVAADYWQRKYRYLSDASYVSVLGGKEALVRELVQDGQMAPEEVPPILGYRPGWLS